MLTASAVANASPKAKQYKLSDARGMYLLVTPSGGKLWRFKFRCPRTRKENVLSLGAYPEISLRKAREQLQKARDLLAEGINPAEARKQANHEAIRQAAIENTTFATVARAWFHAKSPGWSQSTRDKARLILDAYLLPAIGDKPVSVVTSAHVLAVVKEMYARVPSLAKKAAGHAKAVIRYAIAEGLRDERTPLDLALRDVLPRMKKGHHPAATTPEEVAMMMNTIKAMTGPVTRAALLVCAYTAQRPGNVAAMRWQDVNMDLAEWTIPAGMMKTGNAHSVPLSSQVLDLLQEMADLDGMRGYVFPPVAPQGTPHLHRDALSKALREAGLRGKQTPHGLRATLRTVARERLGVAADVLEAQLAHAKRTEVAAAYDRTGFLDERRELAQSWADYLDSLSRGADVVAFRKAGG